MTTRAFDTALFVATPANVGDGVVVSGLGPPFATQFAPLAQAAKAGVVVGASMPAATAVNQVLVSGPGPGFAWGLATNTVAGGSVPPATAPQQLIIADSGNLWEPTTIATVLSLGGAVTQGAGGTLVAAANLVFTAAASLTTRIDGGNPSLSQLDNFTLDCGTF